MDLSTPGVSQLPWTHKLRPSRAGHPLHKTATRLTLRAGPPPPPTDHRPLLRPVRNQGPKGYCFAFATALVKEANCVFWNMARGGDSTPLGQYLSPDYVGWKTQVAEGTFGLDEGGSLADSFASAQGWGISPESFLPYDAGNKAHAGNAQADVAAQPYRFREPCSVDVHPDVFAPVAAGNHVIAFGFSVYPSFEDTGPDGVVKPVKPGEPLLGGHAVGYVGFELSPVSRTRYSIVRNSWDTSWGDKGYCYIQDEYFAHIWDAWTTAS